MTGRLSAVMGKLTGTGHIVCALLLLLCCPGVRAQNWDNIRESPEYLYGEGFGTTVAEADNQALSDLISKIALNVSSATSQNDNETVTNDKVTSNSDFTMSVKTYSQATLTNTGRIILSNEPDAHVGRWIRRAEVRKIFEARKLKIRSLVDVAEKAEAKLKIGDALRCYYWAYILLRSLQHPEEMTTVGQDGKTVLMSVWLPEKLNDLLDGMNATCVRKYAGGAELKFTYKGQPVSAVDYTYFDGSGWSAIYSAADGVGVLELPSSSSLAQYQLKYEFEYRGQAHIDKEIESVINCIKSTPFKAAYVKVKASVSDGTEVARDTNKGTATAVSTSSNGVALQKPVGDAGEYARIMAKVADAVKSRRYGSVDELFTDGGLDIYNRLVKYGSASVVGNPTYKVYQDGDNVIGRGLQMSFSFKNGVRKAFVEELVFYFDRDGKICNMAFGLGQRAEEDILGKGKWSEAARKAILNFLENYKTAFALKRIDYIRTIFDDDAVIITGSVARRSYSSARGREGRNTIAGGNIIRYNRQTKDGYLANLQRTFDSNEFVNIRFADNDVYKMGTGSETYAIQIAQDYYSTNYGDKGYLFLIVDVNDPDNPIIKVRTWQPEKDPNFGLYGPGDF